jgi:Mg2+/citrate symporter
LGLLGLVQVIKHTEPADRHALIARAIRARIGEVANANGGTSIEMIHSIAAKKHKEKAGLAYKLRARWFWMSMHLAITVVGLVIATLNYMKAL